MAILVRPRSESYLVIKGKSRRRRAYFQMNTAAWWTVTAGRWCCVLGGVDAHRLLTLTLLTWMKTLRREKKRYLNLPISLPFFFVCMREI